MAGGPRCPAMTDISLSHVSLTAALSILLSVAVAFLIHWMLYSILLRLVRRSKLEPALLPAIYHPTRWLLVLLALSAGLKSI